MVVEEARSVPHQRHLAIREDVYSHRAWLDPQVYATLIRKIAIVGTESDTARQRSRRSWLVGSRDTLGARVRTLASFWVGQARRALPSPTIWKIARTQHRREEELCRDARRFLFCDTTPGRRFTGASGCMAQRIPACRSWRDRDGGATTRGSSHCADDFAWVQDSSREMSDGRARRFQEQQVARISRRAECLTSPRRIRWGIEFPSPFESLER